MVESCDGVSAARDRDELAGLGARRSVARDIDCAGIERRHLEGAERAVPHQRRRVVDRPLDPLDRLRADVEHHAVGRDRVEAVGVRGRVGLKTKRHDRIDGQNDRAVRVLGLGQDAARGVRHVLFGERLLHVHALRKHERVRHRAADHQRLHPADEVFEQLQLGRDLGAPDQRNHGALRVVQRLAERLELGLHRAARIGRQLAREAFGRGVGAMRGRERVVHIDVAELRKLIGESRVVLFFFLVEAGVFQQQHVAVLHRGDSLLGSFTDAIIREADVTLEDVVEFSDNRLQ